MQFKIGQTVVRHDPGNHEVTFSVQNSQDVKYHTDLQARDYPYTDVSKRAEIDFDLPTVAPAPMSKPRVHVTGENVCVACEG